MIVPSPTDFLWSGESQPMYSFSENTDTLQDHITIDILGQYQEFVSSGTDSGVTTGSETIPQPNGSSGYQCNNFTNGNGIMRSYSGDLTQQINQPTTLSSINPMGLHPQMQYQSSSPNGGDGGSSTHNSPFTPSPPQGFDYPTSPHVKPSIPSNTDYPGDYGFQINFGETTESAPKSAQYTYSPSLNKLFVKMNVTCPIRFKCERPPPMNSIVRAIPVFKRPEHVTDIVTRCPNHRIPDEHQYLGRSGHLIRAEMPDDRHVRYDVASDHRESVSVLYERPQVGAEFTTVLYKFMCLSSCVGGINRRPLLTVFVLENAEGQVLGRRVVEVRICSCPGRDRSQEEKRKTVDTSMNQGNGQDKTGKRPYKNLHTSMELVQSNSAKKKRSSPGSGDQEEFILRIRGREKYLMLKRVKEALDLMEYVTPQQQEAYRNKENQEEASLRQLTTDARLFSSIPSQPEASSNPSTSSNIATHFSVADPIVSDITSVSTSSMLTPSHSNQPLTATPTGSLSTPPLTEFSQTSASDPAPDFPQHGNYWTVDASQLGCDVPDQSGSQVAETLEAQPSTSWSQNFAGASKPASDGLTLNREPSSLARECSGLSTLSFSSQSSEPAIGRYITRILLRQTVSLNRGTNSNDWKLNDDKPEEPLLRLPTMKSERFDEEDDDVIPTSSSASTEKSSRSDLNFV
ncbi:uncharacterized protein LOC143464712 isoform X3 [Clavelina lepadiformis]|uniref:uncharacterized protein LOC143464712 isoform X3 n=1 Tax=Clavelina lepadiformis TaxID=159417 RepID=UPI0040428709